MEVGIDSFIANVANEALPTAVSPPQRMVGSLQRMELADQVGLDFFGIGEHHRQDFLDSAPAVILAAAAARTKQIRLTSAVTVLSAADPVRVFQSFATLDLISQGRAEMVVGRVSAAHAKGNSHLAGSGRHAGIFRQSRHAGSSVDGCDHWRGDAQVPARWWICIVKWEGRRGTQRTS